MVTYNISELEPNVHYKGDLTLDDLFLINTEPCTLSRSIISALVQWGFKTIYGSEEKKISPARKSSDYVTERNISSSSVDLGKTESVDFSEFMDSDEPKPIPQSEIPNEFKTSESVDIDEFMSSDEPVKPQPKPVVQEAVSPSLAATTTHARTGLSEYLVANKPEVAADLEIAHSRTDTEEDEEKKVQDAQEVYTKFSNFIGDVFTQYATRKTFNINTLNEKVLEFCNYIRENKKYILRISPNNETRNKNFIISHSIRTTIHAIIIGQQLKMPYDKLVELGVTSLLHEIGQIRIPPQLYMNNKELTPSEKIQMQTHTIVGYNIIKDAGFPLAVQLGVLEHHERETGTGYPRHLSGNKISLYAKIIAVACSFEAITAPRHFKEEKTTYEGMVEMLKNSNHLYDDTVVKALLFSLSLFPIGAYVYLSNGKVAQVVNVSPVSPKNPIVKIIGSVTADGKPKIVQTDDESVRIIRAMNKKETADLKAALGEKD